MSVLLIFTLMVVALVVTTHVADHLNNPLKTLIDPRVIITHLVFYVTASTLTSWMTVVLMATLVWSLSLAVTVRDRPSQPV